MARGSEGLALSSEPRDDGRQYQESYRHSELKKENFKFSADMTSAVSVVFLIDQ